jgi:hypothetical protein
MLIYFYSENQIWFGRRFGQRDPQTFQGEPKQPWGSKKKELPSEYTERQKTTQQNEPLQKVYHWMVVGWVGGNLINKEWYDTKLDIVKKIGVSERSQKEVTSVFFKEHGEMGKGDVWKKVDVNQLKQEVSKAMKQTLQNASQKQRTQQPTQQPGKTPKNKAGWFGFGSGKQKQ